MDRAVLIASELVSNVIIHASSGGELALDVGKGQVRLAVTDQSDRAPDAIHHARHDTHGRGLAIVAALASQWGIEVLDKGKVVWATLVDPPLGRREGRLDGRSPVG